jgi:hypothetical protein
MLHAGSVVLFKQGFSGVTPYTFGSLPLTAGRSTLMLLFLRCTSAIVIAALALLLRCSEPRLNAAKACPQRKKCSPYTYPHRLLLMSLSLGQLGMALLTGHNQLHCTCRCTLV